MDNGNKVPFYKGPIMIIPFIGFSVGIALWLLITRTWPADVLLRWQGKFLNGMYYPKATFAVLWIGVVLIFFAAIGFMEWLVSLFKSEIKK